MRRRAGSFVVQLFCGAKEEALQDLKDFRVQKVQKVQRFKGSKVQRDTKRGPFGRQQAQSVVAVASEESDELRFAEIHKTVGGEVGPRRWIEASGFRFHGCEVGRCSKGRCCGSVSAFAMSASDFRTRAFVLRGGQLFNRVLKKGERTWTLGCRCPPRA